MVQQSEGQSPMEGADLDKKYFPLEGNGDFHDMKAEKQEYLSGVLFSRSVRSSFASLSLAPASDDDILLSNKDDNDEQQQQQSLNVKGRSSLQEDQPILVRLQFMDHIPELRSFCRRMYKLGDKIHIIYPHRHGEGGSWKDIKTRSDISTEWNKPRLVLNLSSIQEASQVIKTVTVKYWDMPKCQVWQKRHLPCKVTTTQKQQQQQPKSSKIIKQDDKEINNEAKSSHGGGIGKRLQGEHVANFLIRVVMNKLMTTENNKNDVSALDDSQNDSSTGRNHGIPIDRWATNPYDNDQENWVIRQKAIDILNAGSGVIDAAGGSGHVSMALGLAGVQSTVVDPRPGVGKLPGRDRKVWNRALRNVPAGQWRSQSLHRQDPGPSNLCRASSTEEGKEIMQPRKEEKMILCQPVIPFSTFRGWFGSPPTGVDASFRHPDEVDLPICNDQSDLLSTCSAIIALHPDEATGMIVDVAVKNRIPFVVVPCCVFCRLFPNRRIIISGRGDSSCDQAVSTYEDLVEYLMAKHESIQKTQLPFDGKNTVLWSSF